MDWKSVILSYKTYLKLERGLSKNTVEAYLRDIGLLNQFVDIAQIHTNPSDIKIEHLRKFIAYINELGMEASSQARILSGLKSFYKFLLLSNQISDDPTELLESPRLGRHLPETLNHAEIERVLSAIDLSKPEGERNKAIIEVLYGCGLRVSELIGLKITNLFLAEEFIKVKGKGSKERLVPIGSQAIKQLDIYLNQVRIHQKIQKGHEDIVFLNRNGKILTRVMIFTIVKNLALLAEIKKNISPHTFRHSFATELVEGGADLRAVQEMLGHESILTTEIYTHLNREYLRDTLLMYHPRSKNVKNNNR